MAHTHNNHYYTTNNQAPLTAQSAHTTHTTYHNYHISQHQIPAHQHAHLPAQHHHSVTNQPDSRLTTQHHDNRPTDPSATHSTHDTPARGQLPRTTRHAQRARQASRLETPQHTRPRHTRPHSALQPHSRPDHPDLPTCPHCTPFAHPDRAALSVWRAHTRCRAGRARCAVVLVPAGVSRCVVCGLWGAGSWPAGS
jgi:hypothetical protein